VYDPVSGPGLRIKIGVLGSPGWFDLVEECHGTEASISMTKVLTDTLAEALRVVGKSTRPAAPAELSPDRGRVRATQLALFARRSHVLAPADVVVPFVPCLKYSCLMLP
jgi:hypothetical protein